METCDRGVIEAREALLKAIDPRTLTRVDLIQEVSRRRDTARLCGSCTALLNLVWDAENQKDACDAAAS
jgi:hypothetical protein